MNGTNSKSFNSKMMSVRYEAEISATAPEVFPLLCPTREYDWIADWNCELVYSQSGYAEDFCVFRTQIPAFGNETWMCTRYEPHEFLQYTRFSADKIMRYDIRMIKNENGKSRWLWTISVVTLNEEGNKFMDLYGEESLQLILRKLNSVLEYYIVNGSKMELGTAGNILKD